MRTVIGRWSPPGVVVLAAAVWAIASKEALTIVMAALLVVYAWMISPAFFPKSADLPGAVEQAVAEPAPLIFWKPGCIHCIRLRVAVGLAGKRVSWVDSSVDEQARTLVRSKNGGDHTTPTVMFGDQTRTNPEAAWVRGLLR